MRATVQTNRVDLVFRAFSDRTRLRILSMLRTREELCVCDIVETLRLPQPKVSRHLAYLRRAGLVMTRKEGMWMYYALAPAKGQFHIKILDCLASCFQDVPELAKDAARLKSSCEPGCCPP